MAYINLPLADPGGGGAHPPYNNPEPMIFMPKTLIFLNDFYAPD